MLRAQLARGLAFYYGWSLWTVCRGRQPGADHGDQQLVRASPRSCFGLVWRVGTALSSAVSSAFVSASILGTGVGGLHFLLRLAWADYYGRQQIGTIGGVTLPMQLGGQALGPVVTGVVFDLTGGYQGAFVFFAGAVTLASLLVLAAVPPRPS